MRYNLENNRYFDFKFSASAFFKSPNKSVENQVNQNKLKKQINRNKQLLHPVRWRGGGHVLRLRDSENRNQS